jgi:uncharacterized protein (TIGR00369 family)
MLSDFATQHGLRLIEAGSERVVGELLAEARHLNANGRVHGGALMAFADELGGMGAKLNLPANSWTTTLESKTNFLRGALPGLLTGEALPLHRGSSTQVWQTTIRDAQGRLIAMVTQTQMVMQTRS